MFPIRSQYSKRRSFRMKLLPQAALMPTAAIVHGLALHPQT